MALGRIGYLVTLGPGHGENTQVAEALRSPNLDTLGPTYMISEQECEEARAALGSKFRSECMPGGHR